MEDSGMMPENAIVIQNMCEKHRRNFFVVKLGHPEDFRGRMAMEVTSSLLLFKAIMAREDITARIGGDQKIASVVLAEIGCMACYDQEAYRRMVAVCKKGLDHAAKVARGELADEGFTKLI